MASRCTSQFLNPLTLLILVLTMMWTFSVTESADSIQLRGEVGGKVTFRCPFDQQKTIQMFYLQKGIIFVNGYYDLKNITEKWENTKLDRQSSTVEMDSLNVSHIGDYQCHIMYAGGDMKTYETTIHLSVTASYSKPEATVSCRDGFGCQVMCASHGGYPRARMMWNVTGNQTWNIVDSNETSDPTTKIFNISSTAYFNCSNGERKFSCSVDNVISNVYPVCEY